VGSILRADDRASLCRRLASLSGTPSPRWGRMDAAAMLAHLRQSALMALGELPVAPKNKRLFESFPVKQLILYVVPFPRGAPTARELLVSSPAPVEESRVELLALLERMGAGPRDGSGPVHPLLGPLSWREWGVLMHKHVDHHLRQFGA
jgi:hypothetical protein